MHATGKDNNKQITSKYGTIIKNTGKDVFGRIMTKSKIISFSFDKGGTLFITEVILAFYP